MVLVGGCIALLVIGQRGALGLGDQLREETVGGYVTIADRFCQNFTLSSVVQCRSRDRAWTRGRSVEAVPRRVTLRMRRRHLLLALYLWVMVGVSHWTVTVICSE